jgi:nicotinamidase/pyrazinamidase
MKPAIIIVDMLEDTLGSSREGMTEQEKIVGPVRDFLKTARALSIPIIFACDSFLPDDFIFRGRMKPHAIRGTGGTRPLAKLEPQPGDTILDKRRFSAFFKTDLDQTLRTMTVDTVVVGGINTHFCVLATALDAVCLDFHSIILEDLSAAFKREVHENCLNLYRNSAIYPILKVTTSRDFLESVKAQDGDTV